MENFTYISDKSIFMHFVFLSIIFLLIINQFFITKKLSLTEIKLKKTIQYLALKEKAEDDNKN